MGGVVALMIVVMVIVILTVCIIINKKAKGNVNKLIAYASETHHDYNSLYILLGATCSLNIETNTNIVYGVYNRGESMSTMNTHMLTNSKRVI